MDVTDGIEKMTVVEGFAESDFFANIQQQLIAFITRDKALRMIFRTTKAHENN